MITFPGDQVAITPLADPAAPTLARGGIAGTTHYGYKVVAVRSTGHTAASAEATYTTGFAALDSAHWIDIVPPVVPGATAWDIYRTTGGSSQGKLGTIQNQVFAGVQHARFRDLGHAATEETAPTENTTGTLALGASSPGHGATSAPLYLENDGNATLEILAFDGYLAQLALSYFAGTFGAPIAPNVGDGAAALAVRVNDGLGHGDASWHISAQLAAFVDAVTEPAGTIGAGWSVQTASPAGTLLERMRIASQGTYALDVSAQQAAHATIALVGRLMLQQLDAGDPHIAGVVYVDGSGNLKLSSGT